jgi:integrase
MATTTRPTAGSPSPRARELCAPRGGRARSGYLRRHDLRHTGLTWMADAGVPVHVLRKIAGHGSLTTTQRYLHPDHRAITDAGEALSAYLSGG